MTLTLDEAIEHAEEVARENDLSCSLYDRASGYSRSHNEDIRTESAKKCEKCAEEHRQLAEWLRELKAHRKAWEKVKEEITFERDRKLGGEAFEAIQYKCYQNTLDIIDKHLSEVEDLQCQK